MDAASWKPGTTRWAHLLTGAYLVGLAAYLPLAIAASTETGWIFLSVIMLSGAGNITAAWLARRHARRTTAPGSGPAPHR